MNIYEITFTSYVYSSMVDFDKTFKDFLNTTNNNPDINIEANRQALLNWLNDWGCRNFYIKYHALASKELLE